MQQMFQAITSQYRVENEADIVVIDTTVEGYKGLIEGVSPDAGIIFVSNAHQLATELLPYNDLRSLSILSHGKPGALLIGPDEVSLHSLDDYQHLTRSISTALADTGTLLLYGCEIAKGEEGRTFISTLEVEIGAPIAASKTLTGHTEYGGDWELQLHTPQLHQLLRFEGTETSYKGVLGTFSFSSVSGSGTDTITETVDGVTVTITRASTTFTLAAAVSGNAVSPSSLQDNDSYTISFDSAVNISSLQILEFANANDGGDYTLSVTGGSGTTISVKSNAAALSDSYETYTPSDWTNVTQVTVSYNGTEDWRLGIDEIAFTAAPANTLPELGGTPADDTATEDVATAIDLSAYNISDSDGDNPITITLGVDRGTIASIDGNGTFDSVTIANSGTTSMTLQGSAANLNTYLNDTSHITFTTSSNDTTTATLTVTPNDGTGDGTADTVDITITSVNDNPTVATLPASVTVTEDTQSNVDLSAVSFADVDSASITVTLDASAGTFATPVDGAGNSVTESLVSATRITLVGSPANINTYLDTASNIQYTAASNVNGNASATITVTMNDGAGSGDVAAGTVNVNVTALNDVPVFSGLDGTPSFTEGGSAVTLDSNVTIVDAELDALNSGNGNYSGASLTIARNGGANSNDALAVASGGNLTVAGGPNGGGTISSGGNVIATISNAGDDDEVTITFADNGTTPTGALVDEVLQAITYQNSANDPTSSPQLDWTFSDGNSGNAQGTGDNPGTVSGSTTVSVTGVNDEPTLTATGGNPTYVEGASASDLFNTVTASTIESGQTITSMTLTVTNVSDGSGASEILSFDGSDVALNNGNSVTTATNSLAVNVSESGGTATVSFSGGTLSTAQLQTLVDGLTYRNTSDNPTTGTNRVVTITSLTDSGGTANSGDDTATLSLASTVSLTAVNDAPVVTNVSGETSNLVVAGGAQNVDLFDDAGLTNADSSDYNGGFITISQNTGTTNGNWLVDGSTVTSGGDATVSAGETIQISGSTIGTVDATDDGQGGNDLTISFTSANATSARIQTLLQNLEYSPPSGIGSRTFTLTVNDNDGTANSGDQDTTAAFTLSITSSPPVIGNLNGDSFTFTEGNSATDLDVGGNVTLTDADSANFDGGTVTVSYQSGQQAEDRIVLDTGVVTLSAGQTAGSTVTVSGTNIGTIQASSTGGANEGLQINLNASSTPTLVQTLLGAIQYNNAGGNNPTDGNRILNVVMTDGDGATSSTSSITVNVNPENDAPTASLPTDVTVTEDTASNVDLSAADFTDEDSTSITVTLTASEGTFATPTDGAGVTETLVNSTTITLAGASGDIDTYLDTASNIQYTGASNDAGDNAATITVTANDGDGSGAVNLGTINLDITAVNDAPTASGVPADVTVTEDTATNFDLSAVSLTDVDGDNLTVTLVASAGTFSTPADGAGVGGGVAETLVNSTTITLAGSATDINTYLDTTSNIQYTGASNASGDNAATFTINANDSTVNPQVGSGNIDITAVNDAPTASGVPADVTVTEDTASNFDLSAVSLTDVDGDNLTVTLVASAGTFSTPADGAGVGGGVAETLVNSTTITLAGSATDINTYLDTTSNIQYTGASNASGDNAATFTINANDSTVNPQVGSGNIDITAVEDLPTSSGNTITMNEDTSRTLTVADFNFSDGDSGDSLSQVRIDTQTLGTGDTLQLSGTDVTDGDSIAVADISGGNLVFRPAANANGTARASFTYSVNDSKAFATSPATLTINVTDVAEPVVTPTPEPEPTPVVVREAEDDDSSDDTIAGASLDDTIEAGGGNDTVTGGDGRDSLTGGPGNDSLDGGNDDDFIDAGVGDDIVIGGTGQDSLFGGAGDDTVNAGDGNDFVKAGDNDTGNDLLTGDEGDDTLGGGAGNDQVEGGVGNDLLWGREGNDNLNGGSGDDIIFNGAGDDTVIGGEGNDTLWASAGDDLLSGGDGSDTFIFGKKSGNDVISDFDASEDVLNLKFSGIADLAELIAVATIATQGDQSGVLINLDSEHSLFLRALSVDELTANNVIF